MSAERHTRQRGLVVQDLLADAQIAVLGTGPALPCLLQCLTLMGVASRHGRIRLAGHLRSVTEEDLAHQFLLSDRDLGRPLGVALADRVRELDPETVVVVSAQPVSSRELVLAVPRLEEVHQIRDDTKVDVWGHVLPGGVFVGPEPAPVIEDGSSVLTAALAGVCGGLLAQTVVTELGAMVDGPAVTADWREERLQVVAPGIGKSAQQAIDAGWHDPDLRGVLDPIGLGGQFTLRLNGRATGARVTAVIDDDQVLVSVVTDASDRIASSVEVVPARRPERRVRPLFWSPLAGSTLEDGGRLPADLPLRVPAGARIVMCGAGALGSWAGAVFAASGAGGRLCVVDMDSAVEAHNLNRQVLFTQDDIGRPKAVRTVERLRRIDPSLDLAALPTVVSVDLLAGDVTIDLSVISGRDDELTRSAQAAAEVRQRLVEELAGASAILSCPDNQQTRWVLNVFAEELGIPLVNGATDGFTGRVHVCDPKTSSMCLVCWLGESIADDATRRSCTDVVDAIAIQSIATSAAVIGSAQTAALLLVLCGAGDRIGRFQVWDGTDNHLEGHRAGDRRLDECPRHLVEARLGDTIRERTTDGHSTT